MLHSFSSILFYSSLSHPNVSRCKYSPLFSTSRRLSGSQQLRRRLLTVTLRVVVHPPPQILTRLLHRQLRLPVELLVRKRRVGSQVEDIALSPGDYLVRE